MIGGLAFAVLAGVFIVVEAHLEEAILLQMVLELLLEVERVG